MRMLRTAAPVDYIRRK